LTDISGKTAVVTGAASGIGRGLALELARQGANVAVADINVENARKVAERIRKDGGRAIAVACDVCERDSIHELKEEVNAALGPVQLVFANAGATSFTPLCDMSDNDVDWIIQVNLMGVMYTTRAFLPDMMAAGGGHLCATASMAGLLPGWIPVHAPYAAAKAGIIALMMNLQMEIRQHNVFTTSYCPGAVASGMKDNNGHYRPARFGGAAKEAAVQFTGNDNTHSNLRFYKPDDIAPMVLNAVRKNRPLVFDHADQRRFFRQTYADIVEQCYDDIAAWEEQHGIPEGNATGASLIEPE
jgi:NAD(P)-dependent dehydrogenase (short-subunit alcohol dehydrogenase family)